MFSKTRPSLNFLGEASQVGKNETTQFHTYAQRVTHMNNMGLLRGDDPRANLDPAEISRLKLRSLDGLENAAISVYHRDRSENRMPTHAASDKAALVRAALLAATSQAPGHDDTTPEMGESAILARNLEKAGLAIYQDYPDDPGVKRILTLAAAAHNAGAAKAAQAGFENGSVIQAASAQNRDPLAVIHDLKSHEVIQKDDIRAGILNADIPTNIDAALETTTPARPQPFRGTEPSPQKTVTTDDLPLMGVQARRAEGRAMAMATQEGGSEFDQNTRKETAHTMMCAAVAVERERQSLVAARSAQQAQTTQRRTTRGNEAR